MNLGPVSRRWLAEIGVRSLADVERIGTIEIFRLLRSQGRAVSLNLVYALEGALMGVHWTKIPGDRKAELRQLLRRRSSRQ